MNTTPGHPFWGGKLDLLRGIARAGLSRTNASRNLHNLINKNKSPFPMETDACLIHVAFRTFRREKIWWPMIRIESWVETILPEVPEVLLGGFKLEHKALEWNVTSILEALLFRLPGALPQNIWIRPWDLHTVFLSWWWRPGLSQSAGDDREFSTRNKTQGASGYEKEWVPLI